MVNVAITGVSGNMGQAVLEQLLLSENVKYVKALMLDNKKEHKLGKKLLKMYNGRLEIIFGDIAYCEDCERLVLGCDYVVNMAAVIPPLSDSNHELSELCNYYGAVNIVKAILVMPKQAKLIHISTVALYGNRNYLHPWGRVGDPLMPSAYDNYAADKLKGERYVLDSDINNWVVLRQTGILYDKMLQSNMNDGLLFHTCFNTPIEWVTAHDSGVLIRRIIEKDCSCLLTNFFKKCYNIGGGIKNRCTGYETFDQGFKQIGTSVEKLMMPTWNSIRNFHGLWFYDGDELNKLFNYQSQSINSFWTKMFNKHAYFRLAKALRMGFVAKFFVKRLLKNNNSPQNWINLDDSARVKAFFGSRDNVGTLCKSWKNYPVLAKGELADGNIDYENLKDISNANSYLLYHGYDESKDDEKLNIDDMRQAANWRGGICLSDSMVVGDLYTKLKWQCFDGHIFYASPYAVLKAGHWCPKCCMPQPWDYDRLSKFMPFYAQVWYDTHAKSENVRYFYDKLGRAKYDMYINFEKCKVLQKE